jgi:hypothetical protein
MPEKLDAHDDILRVLMRVERAEPSSWTRQEARCRACYEPGLDAHALAT